VNPDYGVYGIGGAAVGGIHNAGVLRLEGAATVTGNVGVGGFGGHQGIQSSVNGASSADFSGTAAAPANHAPTGGVSITGTATQGQVLTATNTLADTDGLGTLSYQWKSDAANISGATASTFTLTQAQVGHLLSVAVSYTDGGSTVETVTSAGTTFVANVNDAPTGAVAIAGTATQGQTLTASNTLADVDGLGTISYQWKSDGAAISGATSATFTLTQAQAGHVVTVAASYTDGFSHAESVTSSGTASVANLNDAPTGSVSIAGTATQGQILTASNTLADLDGLGAITYQWKSDGAAISGATSATFTLTQAQVGHAVTVVASYTDGFSHAETVASASVTPTAPAPPPEPEPEPEPEPPAPPAVVTVVTASGNSVTGGAEANVIASSGGADTVSAGAGDDTVAGGSLNDVLQGNQDQDSIAGGGGDDLIYGGQGDDVLQGDAGDDVLFGDKGADRVSGGQGADLMQGGQGDDYLSGDVGDDVVRGGQGDDRVFGGDGSDFLSGDRGDDTLTGGAGADTFYSFGGAGIDLISDFNRAEGDHIQLEAGTAYTVSQVGADVHIDMTGGAEIILAGVQLSSLTGDWIVI
jgi:Ca2+-binding RTX toxin-like protein